MAVGSGSRTGRVDGVMRTLWQLPAKVTNAIISPGGSPVTRGLPAATVTPSDTRYVDLNRGLNQRWVAQPSQVRLATCGERARQVVQEAVRAGKRITVRSGGHCYEDFAYSPDAQVILDLSELSEVGYDARHDAISVGAGALLPSVYAALYRIWGVTLPGGSCSTVAAGGHIVGGGYGLLSRLHGITVDYLYGVEVVCVDRRGRAWTVVATRDSRDRNLRELWWAHTGGGGGNFGVVTRYLLKGSKATPRDPSTFLPAPPAEVYLSSVALDWAHVGQAEFTQLVDNFGFWHQHNSDVGSPYAGLFGLLKLNNQCRDADGNPAGQIVLVTQMDATRPNAAALLDDYLAAVFAGVGAPHRTWETRSGEHEPLPQYLTPQRLPWLLATQQLGGSPAASRADYKSAYLRARHTPEQIDAMYTWLTREDYTNPHALAQVDSYGCQINTVAPEATAVAQRDSILKIQYQTYWEDEAEDAKHLAWIRGMYRDIYASTGGVPAPVEDANTDGCFINYPDIDLSDPKWNPDWDWSTLYYKGNYPRLQAVKRRYDPRNVFRHAQSVCADDTRERGQGTPSGE